MPPHQKIGPPADNPVGHRNHGSDKQIGEKDARAFLALYFKAAIFKTDIS